MKKLLKGRRWTLWWLGIILLSILYLSVSIISCDSSWINSWLQVGGIALTLAVTIIIMFQNNEGVERATTRQIDAYKEESRLQMIKLQETNDVHIKALQESTERQLEKTNQHIEAHKEESRKQIEKLEEITERLEEVAEVMAQMAQMTEKMLKIEEERKKAEEEKVRLREADLKRQEQIFKAEVERLMPAVSFRLEEDIELIFFKMVYIYLYNGGGDITSMRINIFFRDANRNLILKKGTTFRSILRGNQVSLKVGRAKTISRAKFVEIQMAVWDIKQREYTVYVSHVRENNKWIRLNLNSKNLL